MNQETNDFLRKLTEDQDAKQAEQNARPAVEQQFQQDYQRKESLMRSWVQEFNSSDSAQKLNITLRLDGPVYQSGDEVYILRLIGGRSYPDGRVVLLRFPAYYRFDEVVLDIALWQSNLDIRPLNDFSGYPPHQRPQRKGEEKYKLVQSGSAYGWSISKQQPLSFEALFDYFVQRLVKLNLTTSR
jgi:hypothetical protein